MDIAIIDWISDQTGVALFAGLALFITWRTYQDSLRHERANSQEHRQDKLEIVEVLQQVARSNTELCQLIQELRQDLWERRL